ncbi:ABC transporter permease [Paludibacterium denitrificans]|uniref:ABC transporter permease n=1 Tax=Paludibacterium denitrificans TaxID=2675226 RepID=UPI001E28660B|nr:ABC transporter permease [Paludibacterium denitrificans]
MTAEIGLMKATEQLDAMSVMAVNPIARVVAPRFWAGVISMPILAALFNVMGIFGGYLVGVEMIGLDSGTFWSQMQNSVDLHQDVINGLIKSTGIRHGRDADRGVRRLRCHPDGRSVSSATTRTVVTSALVILALDFILTAFMF